MRRKVNFRKLKDKTYNWCNARAHEMSRFYWAHKQEILIFGPIIIGGMISIIKKGITRHNILMSEKLKTRYIYDRSLGFYYELRRKPTANQLLEIEARRKAGEKLGEILRNMKLI